MDEKIITELYIPHGSDERNKGTYLIRIYKDDFISHMVQMKVSHLLILLLSFLTLYPTWFR